MLRELKIFICFRKCNPFLSQELSDLRYLLCFKLLLFVSTCMQAHLFKVNSTNHIEPHFYFIHFAHLNPVEVYQLRFRLFIVLFI